MKLLAPRLGLLLALPLLAGCAPKVGHVTGRVLYRGAPVPAGWVQFRPADPAQNAVSAELDADGNFSADLPAGEVTVAIDNREWEPQPAGIPSLPPGIPLSPEARAQLGAGPPAPKAGGERRGASRAGKYVPIPDRYYAADTSGIKFTVKGGPQTETIELTD